MTGTERSAAQYIRMSTDSQDLSPDMQRAAIEIYAQRNGISVVQTYIDAGKSGLTLAKRPAMRRLLTDVTDPNRSYSIVLVYDVSRWGRFQDTDASAYYEYHCRLQGVDVRYVQEPFGGLNSPLGALFKSIKRAMAAEYSRELSVKTTAGQAAAVSRGFQIGTLPCMGISRVAVSKVDGAERVLGPSDHKSARGEHVRWIPGPATEVAAVRRVFRLYASTELSVVQVARLARSEGVRTRSGRPLTEWMLYRLLRCEALTGNFVWGREENKKRRHPEDSRIRRSEGFMKPIISRRMFAAVQAKLARREHVVLTRDHIVEQLRAALSRNPRLMALELRSHGCACRQTYLKHFGSLRAAWNAAGFSLHVRDHVEYDAVAVCLRTGAAMCRAVAESLSAAGVECVFHRRADRSGQTLLINGRTVLRTQVIWKRPRYGDVQWCLRKVYKDRFDWALVVRLRDDGSPFDSFLVNRQQYFAMDRWLQDALPGTWDVHRRLDDLTARFRAM